MSYRQLRAQPPAEADFDEFLDHLYKALTNGQRDPNDVVRDTLYEIYYGAMMSGTGKKTMPDTDGLSTAARVVLHNFDPRNVTTEPDDSFHLRVRMVVDDFQNILCILCLSF